MLDIYPNSGRINFDEKRLMYTSNTKFNLKPLSNFEDKMC
jgi:hypothetical protein